MRSARAARRWLVAAWVSAAATTIAGPAAAQSPVTLPDFSAVGVIDLRSPSTVRVLERAGRRFPVLESQYGRRVAISGRLVHARTGRGVRGATVYVLDPAGSGRKVTLTDRRGRFRLVFRAARAGVWAVAGLGHPLAVARFGLRLQPSVRFRATGLRSRVGQSVRVIGTLGTPSIGVHRKLVQLQWRDGRQWRALATDYAATRGAFTLRYRFRRLGGYSLRMRLVVPRERGWPLRPFVSRSFVARVTPR